MQASSLLPNSGFIKVEILDIKVDIEVLSKHRLPSNSSHTYGICDDVLNLTHQYKHVDALA